ncbi:alanine racemase [Protaetiibacter intestinalis]|uniref:Alanine racemase n=1 Tax=Protaetiibacter intestinalis TaxID=2419774 RepID=A0A387B200_9MICO|nr:alanine racemase [Protaetiibacter intestinalis]AYF97522.1 alanine racemase [Protaetiibacter intestinalis]
MSAPRREARIHLDALAGNLEVLRRTAAPAQLMAVVKADAYGHGALPVARAAVEAGADWLGTADLSEALALRAAGVTAPLLAWLHGGTPDFADAVAAGVDVGVSTPAQLEAAADAGATVHLKVDTGLSRNGIAPEEATAVFARAAELERAGRLRVRGLMSHLSGTSAEDDAAQRAAFAAVIGEAESTGLAPELRHLAASLAVITQPDARFDLVRVGIAMYGLAPDASVDPAVLGLRPVMRLVSEVAAVRRVPAGTGVSYGFTHRTEGETTLALVPLGYADGIPRHASGRAEVAVAGARHAQVGRIAMDQFVVDVGDAPVGVGDEVVVWGDPAAGEPGAGEWAEAAGTIGYEIVTRIGPRVARVPV